MRPEDLELSRRYADILSCEAQFRPCLVSFNALLNQSRYAAEVSAPT